LQQDGPNGSQKTAEGSQKSSQKKGESSQKILRLLAGDGSMTTQQLADRLGISRRAVAKQVKNLQEQGRLKRVGPDKGGHWEVMAK